MQLQEVPRAVVQSLRAEEEYTSVACESTRAAARDCLPALARTAGADDWYLGCTKPGSCIYSDLFSQVGSGDYIEIVALGAGQEERGILICEVIGQGIDGPTNKSIRGGGHPESSSRPTRTAPPQPGPAMCGRIQMLCRRYMTLTRTACGAEPREGQQLQGGQRLRRSGTD